MAQLSAQLSTEAFNSTSTPLGPGGVFLPAQFEDVSSWNTVTCAVVADAPSSASGLVFEWSADGITVDISIPFTLATMVPRIYDSAILMKFFRVNFTNGAFAQTRFNILTVYRYSSSVILRDIQDGEGDSIMSHPSNSQRVSLVDIFNGADILGDGTLGANAGVWINNKVFGQAPAFTVASAAQTLSLVDNLPDNSFAAPLDFFLRALGYTCLPLLFDGTNWNRQRGNEPNNLLLPGIRTGTTSSADQGNFNGSGVTVFWNVTALDAGVTVTLDIEVKDELAGVYYSVLTSALIAGPAAIRMRVYPGIAAVANLAANDIIPKTWRVTVTHSGAAGNANYSVYTVDQV